MARLPLALAAAAALAACGSSPTPAVPDAATDVAADLTAPDGVAPDAEADAPAPDDAAPGEDVVAPDLPPPPPRDVPTVDVVPVDDAGRAAPETCSRPLLPVSGTRVSTQRPTLQIARGPGLRETRFDICYDRACTSVAASARTTDDYLVPAANLAPGAYFWRITAIAADGAACAGPTWEFVVPARSAMLPRAWGTLLDLNGDGYGDLAAVTGGEVRVFHGTYAGLSATPAVVITGLTTLAGGVTLPAVAAAAGDLNGDGFVDLAIGVPAALDGQGEVWIHRGSPTGVRATPDVTIRGPDGPLGRFGTSLAGVGDIEGDGYGDIVVGAPHAMATVPGDHPGTPGRVYSYHGGSFGVRTTPSAVVTGPGGPDGYFGASVAALGDMDSNRFPDVIVGARGANAAYVLRGTVLGLDATRIITLRDAATPGFGTVVAGAGDVDGDNRADAVVAGSDASNRVVVRPAGVMGDFAGAGVTLTVAGGRFGRSVASADVNADGFADVVVGAPGMGAAFVFAGSMTGVGAMPAFTLRAAGVTNFGESLVSAGDVDRDGASDLAVGGTGAGFQVFAGAASGPGAGRAVATPSAVTGLGGASCGL
ncbi:MAG: FG-GAP-like repeat-containing protein [Polyangiales bacterium]